MAKKKETINQLAIDIEQFKGEYVAYQNKMEGNEISDPLTFSHIITGLQRDVLNIYNILIELSKK